MTSHNDNGDSESEDVTLAAGTDVVAQIRAHAATVRSGEVGGEVGVEVWTAELELPSPAPPVRTGQLLPHDETVVFTAARRALATKPANKRTSGSLIDGLAPPEVSTSFWTTDQPFRASGIDAPSRSWSGRIPLAAWVVAAIVLIIVASVGIAVAIASTGPIT